MTLASGMTSPFETGLRSASLAPISNLSRSTMAAWETWRSEEPSVPGSGVPEPARDILDWDRRSQMHKPVVIMSKALEVTSGLCMLKALDTSLSQVTRHWA